MATYCGEECPFFKHEDIDGYGICDISGLAMNHTFKCSFEDRLKELTNEQAVKVLHHAQKWRRGEKIGMPPPTLLAIPIPMNPAIAPFALLPAASSPRAIAPCT